MTDKFTPGPWAYRPYEHDDWGIVRAPAIDGQFRGGVICQAQNPALSWDDLGEYRIRETDPYEANARRIVECVNACANIPNPAAIADVVAALEALSAWHKQSDQGTVFQQMRTVGMLYDDAEAALASLRGAA